MAIEVSAVLVTRGNVEMDMLLDSLPPWWEKVVLDNSAGCVRVIPPDAVAPSRFHAVPTDLGAYGRYVAIDFARSEIVFVQDDDCIVRAEDIEALVASYEPGVLSALMPPSRTDYEDTVLVGWGALFDRALPMAAFNRWVAAGHELESEDFRVIGADFIFPMLSRWKRIDGEHVNLPWAHDDDRTWSRPGYAETKARFMREARAIRDGAK